ncbi:hypothetical protein DZC44_00005, partial [Campylobacter jejuni]|nr:hypothetical protein [Campylobacter jejuni]
PCEKFRKRTTINDVELTPLNNFLKEHYPKLQNIIDINILDEKLILDKYNSFNFNIQKPNMNYPKDKYNF